MIVLRQKTLGGMSAQQAGTFTQTVTGQPVQGWQVVICRVT